MCIYSFDEWIRWYPNIFERLPRAKAELCINVLSRLDNFMGMSIAMFDYKGDIDCGKSHKQSDTLFEAEMEKSSEISLEMIAELKQKEVIQILCGCSLDIADFYGGEVGFCKLGKEPTDCYNILLLLSMKKRNAGENGALGKVFKDYEDATTKNKAEFGAFATHGFDKNDYALYNIDVDRKRIDAFWKEHHDDNP